MMRNDPVRAGGRSAESPPGATACGSERLRSGVLPESRGVSIAGLLLCVLWLCACGADTTPAPTATDAATSAPSVQPSATPLATPDPRVAWPPDPKAFVPTRATIVDSSEVDTDGDGVGEMLVIYQDKGSGHGLVIRREGAGGLGYPLGGDANPELFRDHWVSNTVRDVNKDGKVEEVVRGVVNDRAETVTVFQWNGSVYTTLLTLNGPEGVAMDDSQNNGVLDFTALQMLFQRSAIIHTVHAEWAGTGYQQSDDVLFLLGSAIDFGHPEETVLAYYRYWNNGDADQMFALLAEPQKSRTPASALAELTRATSAVHVEALTVDSEDAASATVTANIRTVDRSTSKAQTSQPRWRMTFEDGQWRLAGRIDTNP